MRKNAEQNKHIENLYMQLNWCSSGFSESVSESSKFIQHTFLCISKGMEVLERGCVFYSKFPAEDIPGSEEAPLQHTYAAAHILHW